MQEKDEHLVSRAVQKIQLYEISPEEINKPIIDEIRNGFEVLLKEFQPRQPDELLTLTEAARILKVDASTIHHWRKRKIISAESIGNRVYIRRSVIEAALQPLK